MSKLQKLKKSLKRGSVYRRSDLTLLSTAVDRHLGELLADGTLTKLSQGLYYYPEMSAFGPTPPEDDALIRSFLKDDRFLSYSLNAYNRLGIGTTQLYNSRIVYNHKRHGEIKIGNRTFQFQLKHHFPTILTPEFLLVDLINNIDQLAEDKEAILNSALSKAKQFDRRKMKKTAQLYGGARAKKMLAPILNDSPTLAYAG